MEGVVYDTSVCFDDVWDDAIILRSFEDAIRETKKSRRNEMVSSSPSGTFLLLHVYI